MTNTEFKPIERSTMDVKEAAEYVGISEEKLRLLVRENAFPHLRIGRRILTKKDKIDEWMDSQMSGE